jgi:lysophospholipase L1-like esterase
MREWKIAIGAAVLIFLASAADAATDLWVRSWAAAPVQADSSPAGTRLLADVTFRTVARVSAGGSMLRIRLSNEMSNADLQLGAVHVALAGADGVVVAGSDRVVTFAGVERPLMSAGSPIVSDPVTLSVPAFGDVVVSIHVPGDASALTVHLGALATTRIARGDQTGAATIDGGMTSIKRHLLTGIDVFGDTAKGTIVALGDSITDGAKSTMDGNARWPDVLAARLRARFGIANAGIGGNRLLSIGAGPAALARLDRDVLSVPGIRYLVLLEGINDIGNATRAKTVMPPEAIIAAYRQIIARVHDRGVKVIGATILPYKGANYYAPDGDATRRAVNAWIRTPGNFDGVIDFERAVADPADPTSLAAIYDSGDKLHLTDAGYRRMAEAIDLGLFR